MLFLKPLFTVNRVTVFGDHADKDQFYYLPENPRISSDREGKPAFTFMKYMRDITDNPQFNEGQQLGGGFALVTVDLALDETTRADIMSLARRTGSSGPRLASAPFHVGTVRLVALDASEDATDGRMKFVEKVEGTAIPSLFGDLRATFGVRLSQEGAELLEKAFQQGGQPIGVVYEVKFMGLQPAFHVKVHADYKRIYNEFGGELGAQVMMIRAQIEAAFQKLQEQRAIQVEALTFSDDAGVREAKQQALQFLKDQLLKDFFTPSLPLPQRQAGDIMSGLANLLQQPQMTGRALGAGALAAPAPQQAGAAVSQQARQPAVRPPHPPTAATEATTPAALATESADNPANHPSAPRPVPPATDQSLPAAGGPAAAPGGAGGAGGGLAVSFKLRFIHQEELKTFDAEWKESMAVERTHSPNGGFGVMLRGLKKSEHFMAINLDSTFFQRMKIDAECPANFASLGLSEIKVHIEYGDRGDGQPHFVDDLELKPDAQGAVTPKVFTCGLDPAKNLDFKYKIDYFFKAADDTVRGQRTRYTSPGLIGLGPMATITVNPEDHVGFLKVDAQIGELDFAEIQKVQVKIGYDDNQNQFHVEDTFLLTNDKKTFDWTVRLSNPELKDYWYEVIYFLKDDQRITVPRQTKNSRTLVINEPWQDRIKLLVDAQLSAGLTRMVLELEYKDESIGYRFTDLRRITKAEEAFFNLAIPILNPSKRKYRYRLTTVESNNTVKRGELVETDQEYLPLTAPQ